MVRKLRPNICTHCGSDHVEVRHESDAVDFKGLTLEVDGLAKTVCTACKHSWTTPGQEADNLALLREAFAAERDRMRAELGLLSGEQIALALEQLRLTRAEAATLFGGGPNAFAKYVNGDVLQSVPMDRLLRLTVAFGDLAAAHLRSDAIRKPPVLCGAFVWGSSVLDAGSMTVSSATPMARPAHLVKVEGQATRGAPISIKANDPRASSHLHYAKQ